MCSDCMETGFVFKPSVLISGSDLVDYPAPVLVQCSLVFQP